MKFYRYRLFAKDEWGQDYNGEYCRTGRREVDVIETVYSLIKETPKGYWISNEEFDVNQRWIPKQSRKRFAYPTRKEALESFIRRQEERIRILSVQISDSKTGLFQANSKLKDL